VGCDGGGSLEVVRMGIKFYKKWLNTENRYQYEERNSPADDDSMIEISQEEYETETMKQWEEYLASLPVEEPTDEISAEEFLQLIEEAL